MSSKTADSKHPFNEDVRQRLDDYRNSFERTLTNKELASELDCGVTQISKYLNGRPDWDVTALESAIEDVLKTASMRRALALQAPLATNVTTQVNAVCETIRKTDDIGLIYGPAGTGKTVGIALYVKDHPTAISVTLTKWSCTSVGLERIVFRALETRSFERKAQTRAEWLVDRLRNSKRLLLLDNAQRLTKSGLQWLFDFHDATGIPIVLVGNPEVLDQIRANDQQFSRIGIVQEVRLKDGARIAREIIRRLIPGAEGDIADLGRTIAENRGHLRSLKKHLLLIPELIDAFSGNVRESLLAAHTQLVSDYELN